MASKSEKVIESFPNIAEKIWDSIRTLESHQTRCPFCDNPRLVETLISFINRDISFSEISIRLQIPLKIIKTHIEEVLNISSLEMMSNVALLKIISKIDTPEVLDNVKAADVIKAINSLINFEAVKKDTKGSIKESNRLGRMSSLELVTRNTETESKKDAA